MGGAFLLVSTTYNSSVLNSTLKCLYIHLTKENKSCGNFVLIFFMELWPSGVRRRSKLFSVHRRQYH